MSNPNQFPHKTILQLERLKREVPKSNSKEDLLRKIDMAIEMLYGEAGDQQLFVTRQEGHLKIRHLKELRAALLEVDDEQLKDYFRNINMTLGSVQFDLWQGRNEELFQLLDSLEDS